MLTTPVRVRFAPSPTGRFHIGSARTALYNYLLARQTNGQFIFRIEDTDQKRYVAEAEPEFVEALKWHGLSWDEGPDVDGPHAPYRQSLRGDIYHEQIQEMIDREAAYPCFCSQDRLSELRKIQQAQKKPTRYDGLCRRLDPKDAAQRRNAGESHVVRFKTPYEGETTAIDALVGPIIVKNETLDDYILLKSDGLPTYHLAAMVDDHLMEVSHVFRGSEWLATFPLHVLIYQAMEWTQPVWVHLSVFLNPSGKGKLSKRQAADQKGGATAIFSLDLRDLGYMPEAVNNWLALMGWSYDDHTELFSMEELIEKFSIEKLNPSPASVNYSKLDHFNGIYIRNLATNELEKRIEPFFTEAGIKTDPDLLSKITPIIQERIRTLDEAVSMTAFFFQDEVHPETEELIGKNLTPTESVSALRESHRVIQEIVEYEVDPLESELRELAEQLNLKAGQLFSMIRIAVTGQRVSPPLIETMVILGKEIVLKRCEAAIQQLKRME